MADEPQNGGDAGEETGLSWAVALGAVSGLVTGVVLAMLVAAGLHRWDPESRMAEVFWEIASPLLGIAGVVVGALSFQRFLHGRPALALILTAALVVLGLCLAFGPVGFPWRGGV
jgi:hypothetical protein